MKEDTKTIDRRTFLRYPVEMGAMAEMSSTLPSYSFSSLKNREVLTPQGPDNAIDLTISKITLTIAGKQTEAITINGTVPGPLIRLKEGEDVLIRVTNKLDEDTSIHWHGILLPFNMDGVPGVSNDFLMAERLVSSSWMPGAYVVLMVYSITFTFTNFN